MVCLSRIIEFVEIAAAQKLLDFSQSNKNLTYGLPQRSTLFSTQIYQKSIWAMLTCGKCKFLFEYL